MSGARPAAQGGYHHIFQEVVTMINFRIGRVASAAAILTMLASSAAFPAAARPLDPIYPAPNRSIAFSDSPLDCPLRRIDRQLIRCDNLTGAGVPAPLFIPEL